MKHDVNICWEHVNALHVIHKILYLHTFMLQIFMLQFLSFQMLNVKYVHICYLLQYIYYIQHDETHTTSSLSAHIHN